MMNIIKITIIPFSFYNDLTGQNNNDNDQNHNETLPKGCYFAK